MNCKELLDNYNSLPQAVCWTIITDISRALSDVHKVGIAHLDIKPSNVLVVDMRYFKG